MKEFIVRVGGKQTIVKAAKFMQSNNYVTLYDLRENTMTAVCLVNLGPGDFVTERSIVVAQ